MNIDIKEIKGKYRLVYMCDGEPITVWDDYNWESRPMDGGGYDTKNEAMARRASEVSRKAQAGPTD